MNGKFTLNGILVSATIPALTLFLAGCASYGPTKEKGPENTIAYLVQVESSQPGVQIETSDDFMGRTPCTVKIFGDKDGTFHNFGSEEYFIRALPLTTNQFTLTKVFRAGGPFSRADKIPRRIYFDMSQENGGFSTDEPPQY